jgi:hypothetical protein
MTKIAQLEAVLPSMTDNTRSFAQSLINQSRTRSLSDRQMFFVEKLIREASQPAKAAPVAVGSMSDVVALFDRVSKHLKRPAVVLRLQDAEEIRVSRYGAGSKYNGQIKVASATIFDDGNYGPQGRWYGTIATDGTYSASRKAAEKTASIAALLTAFAADPAKVAAEHGKLMGRCCFCNRSLSDEDSTGVGYGPVCAKRYGLPYGAAARVEIEEDRDELTGADVMEDSMEWQHHG